MKRRMSPPEWSAAESSSRYKERDRGESEKLKFGERNYWQEISGERAEGGKCVFCERLKDAGMMHVVIWVNYFTGVSRLAMVKMTVRIN